MTTINNNRIDTMMSAYCDLSRDNANTAAAAALLADQFRTRKNAR